MRFQELAQYFEKLEATPKRLEMIYILARLFGEAKADEIGKICYLIQGRVAPRFEPIEIGMAESTIAQAVARAFGSDKERVLKLYRQKGNFGVAASELATNLKLKTSHFAKASRDRQNPKLSVYQVFEQLLAIKFC
jgi:DNA ligase-1